MFAKLKKAAYILPIAAISGVMLNISTASASDKINAVSCFPVGSVVSKGFEAVIKEINEKGKGVVKVELKGGAPAIGSPFTLVQKVSRGVYDFVGCTDSYFGNVLPEAPVFRLSEHPYKTLRQNGAIDAVNELLDKKGLRFLGRYEDLGPFALYLSKKIDKPDLTGLNLRVSPVYTAFFKELGATTQTSTLSEIYTYMENGTVQGFGWPTRGWLPTWAKVTKYRVEPGFYNSTLVALFNSRKWKSLSKKSQEIIQAVVLEFEQKNDTDTDFYKEKISKQHDWFKSQGVVLIKLEGKDAEKWSSTAKKAAWDEVIQRSPENGKKLMKLFTK